MATTVGAEVESCICANVAWQQLPDGVKMMLGNSQKEYDKLVVEYSVKNQLRHKGNLGGHIRRDAELYYESVMKYSGIHLMLFPYHLADIVVKELRMTAFNYYIQIIIEMINNEKSYDSLPNFTAADAMRLLGIGRNQYIDLMNQNRSNRRLFRRSRSLRELLPQQPVPQQIEPWWIVRTGCILEADVKLLNPTERGIVDILMVLAPSAAGTPAGLLDHKVVQSLYHKGLIYFDVPVKDDDYIYVGPLDGFVMNRVMGDYFETLLYKIFVTIDGMTTVAEIADMLHIDIQLVKNACSVFCRLAFAKKRVTGMEGQPLHASWLSLPVGPPTSPSPLVSPTSILVTGTGETTSLGLASPSSDGTTSGSSPLGQDLSDCLRLQPEDEDEEEQAGEDAAPATTAPASAPITCDAATTGRIAFLFDANLTAFLMMGNLSASLKGHAVTLFEVGKLTDEQLKDFMEQLENVNRFAEGEAQRFSEHATSLLHTMKSLRAGRELDLLRGESLLSLDAQSRARVLHKSYGTIVAMAPLSVDACALPATALPLLGPPIPEVCAPWGRLALYALTGSGLPSLFVPKGTRLPFLPRLLTPARRLLVSTLNQAEPQILAAHSALSTVNELLQTSAVLVQEFHHRTADDGLVHVPFPFGAEVDDPASFANHPAVRILRERIGLGSLCGYVVLVQTSALAEDASMSFDEPEPTPYAAAAAFAFSTPKKRKRSERGCALPEGKQHSDYCLLDVVFGIPLFDDELNRTICERIQTGDVLSQDNRVAIQFANKTLVDLISDLIQKHNFGVNATQTHTDRVEVVPPVRPIGFDPDAVLKEGNTVTPDAHHPSTVTTPEGIVVYSPVDDPY